MNQPLQWCPRPWRTKRDPVHQAGTVFGANALYALPCPNSSPATLTPSPSSRWSALHLDSIWHADLREGVIQRWRASRDLLARGEPALTGRTLLNECFDANADFDRGVLRRRIRFGTLRGRRHRKVP